MYFFLFFSQIGLEITVDEARKLMGMLKYDHIKEILSFPRVNEEWIKTFNNFALAQLIVGSGWETYQVFLNKLMRIDGHMASAMVLTSTAMTFILVAVCSLQGRY